MMKNRSVPADVVLPHITYRSVADAMAWLTRAFGFTEHYRYGEPGGRVNGAQMHLGGAWIMLASARPGRASPAEAGYRTQSLTIFVDDVDAHFERAKSAGVKIVEDLHETVYGERQYGAEDLDGHHWLFSRHARDVSPDEWGATIVEGHTEWTWTARSYTVQTDDQGAVTGAQASIYVRAKLALDQSLALLDGLYALVPNLEAEDLARTQEVIRGQLTVLVDEFGVAGGPRVSRVDEMFELLLGPGNPANPEDVPGVSSLGLVRQRFGLERGHVNSVEDEQNLTNYLILAGYLIGLKQIWNHDKGKSASETLERGARNA